MAGLFDKLGQTWPAELAKSIYGAFSLPGQVAGGILNVQPSQPGMWSDEDEARQQATQQTMMNRAADLGGLVTGGSYAAAPAMKDATGMGIRAYHGSPHDFDRFDLSKIGTGEGAQVYGHGLYFAEKEGIAKHYRDTLTADRTQPAQRLLNKLGGDPDAAIAAAKAEIARLQGLRLTPETGLDRAKSMIETQENNIAMLNQLKSAGHMSPGRMYEVDINARPEQFLDWDKPLKAQPVQQNVLSAVRPEMRGRVAEEIDDGLLGQGAFAYLNTLKQVGDRTRSLLEPATQSQRLLDAGIPGIKYLDQGSRGAGEGSRNYVVFDDKLVNILRKYGILGPVAAGGLGLGNEAQAAP